MSDVWKKAQGKINAKVGPLGSFVIRRVVSQGTLNETTGQYDGRMVSDTVVPGVIYDPAGRLDPGTVVRGTKEAFVTQASPIVPKSGDLVIIDGEEVPVSVVNTLRPDEVGGDVLGYELTMEE